MKGVWIVLVSFLSLLVCGECECIDARAGGMSNAHIAVAGDVWTVFHNVGGLSSISTMRAGVSYTPGLFNLSELSNVAAAFGIPTSAGFLGFAANRYGCDLYNELTFGASYASFLSDFHFGVNCWYHAVHIAGYGSAGTIVIDAGFLVCVLPELDIGLILRNINSSTIGDAKEKLPHTIGSGISYRPVKNLTVAIDLEKETMSSAVFRCGIEYFIGNICALRAGISNECAHYSGGIGLRVSSFRFDYGISVHRSLGLTHVLSVTFL
jgi:hypothetical protein